MSKPAAKPEEAAVEKPSLIQRLRNLPTWVRRHSVKAAILFSIIFSLMGATLFGWAVISAKQRQIAKELAYTPKDIYAAIDDGDLPKALQIAQHVARTGNVSIHDAGAPAYLFGLAALKKADTPLEAQQHRAYQIAAHWFEEAYHKGVPPERRPELVYLTAKSLYLSRRFTEAVPLLRKALPINKQFAVEIRRYLGRSLFLQATPDFPQALAEITSLLDQKRLEKEDLRRALTDRAEVLLRLGRLDDARHDIAAIPADTREFAEGVLLEGRICLQEARLASGVKGEAALESPSCLQPLPELTPEVERKLNAALLKVDEAKKLDKLSSPLTPQSYYVAGLCEDMLGKVDAATISFNQAYRRAVDSPEGFAARIQSAHLARRRNLADDAVTLYDEVFQEIGPPIRYSNRWLSLPELKSCMLATYQDFFHRKQFAASANFADLLPRLLDEDLAVQLAADAHAAWARQLVSEGPGGRYLERHPPEDVRKQYRTASKLYERLAELRFTQRDYSENIWIAAKYSLQGRDYDNASRLLRKYLEIESRNHHAEALVGLAEVMLTNERQAEALALLKQCLDTFPRDAAVFRARLLLADLYGEMNQWEPAEKILLENLNSETLTPNSEEWRRSLFSLGRLLYDRGRYPEAAARLDEAVQRYSNDPDAIEARYCAGEAHRRVAQRIADEVPPNALPAERAKLLRETASQFEKALLLFDETIVAARNPDNLAGDEAGRLAMLRNALFGRGSILHALGRYEDSLRAYQTAISAFPQSPAVLDAYLQMADCHRRQQRLVEARGTVEQAKLMLNRLPKDAPFAAVSNYSREEWAKLLDTLSAL
ncbi:MAG: tetratricopeptide repeat protein [Pirellulales bacterium]